MFDPKIHLLAIATAQGVSLPGTHRIPGWLNGVAFVDEIATG